MIDSIVSVWLSLIPIIQICDAYLNRRRDATEKVLDRSNELMTAMRHLQHIGTMKGFEFDPLLEDFKDKIALLDDANKRCKHYKRQKFRDTVNEFIAECQKMVDNTRRRVQFPDNVDAVYGATECYYKAGELLTKIRELT